MKICEKCGNPQKMYWCAKCVISDENPDLCPECGKRMKLDKHYHKECNALYSREDIEMLERENKAMADALLKLNYTPEQISDICNGTI